MSDEKREEVTREVFKLFDADRNGVIEKEEFLARCERGVRLPDFGVSGSLVLWDLRMKMWREFFGKPGRIKTSWGWFKGGGRPLRVVDRYESCGENRLWEIARNCNIDR